MFEILMQHPQVAHHVAAQAVDSLKSVSDSIANVVATAVGNSASAWTLLGATTVLGFLNKVVVSASEWVAAKLNVVLPSWAKPVFALAGGELVAFVNNFVHHFVNASVATGSADVVATSIFGVIVAFAGMAVHDLLKFLPLPSPSAPAAK